VAKKPNPFAIKGKKFRSDTGGTVTVGKAKKLPKASKGVRRVQSR